MHNREYHSLKASIHFFYLLTGFILICSCNTAGYTEDLSELQRIIERDFRDIPTTAFLIPIRITEEYQFEDFPINYNRESSVGSKVLETPKNLAPPPPPDSNENHKLCKKGHSPFHQLILNKKISKEDFDQLISTAIRVKNRKARIKTKSTIPFEYDELKSNKLYVPFQTFAYPIVTRSHMIIYKNTYHTGGGNGMFYVYEKIDGCWVKVFREGTWISCQ